MSDVLSLGAVEMPSLLSSPTASRFPNAIAFNAAAATATLRLIDTVDERFERGAYQTEMDIKRKPVNRENLCSKQAKPVK